MTPHDIMRGTAAIGDIGAAFYFDPITLERGKAAGLDGFRLYFLGRGGVLGDVEADVVRSAFGYFAPEVVAKTWTSAKQIMAPRDAGRLYNEAAQEFGRMKLAGVDGLDAFIDAAATVIGAVEGCSLPLFAALRAEPVPDDTPAAAYHQATVLRELRGSVHLLAVTACGLRTEVAHAIKRPGDVQMFGYQETPAVTDADRAAWDRAEALTDEILAPAYAALSNEQAQALVSGTAAIAAALGVGG